MWERLEALERRFDELTERDPSLDTKMKLNNLLLVPVVIFLIPGACVMLQLIAAAMRGNL